MERQTRIGLVAAILMTALACAPLLPSVPALPTRPAGAVSTMVAGTHDAAIRQTAQFLPPSATPTITRMSSRTPTITTTPTATFIFPTFTPIPAATKGSGGSGGGSGGGGGGGGGGDNYPPGGGTGGHYLCVQKNVSPADNSHFSPYQTFTTVWTVKNVGLDWDPGSVDYAYYSGAPLALQNIFDLPGKPGVDIVKYGETIGLPVRMMAPGNSGTYKTTWVMKLGTSPFCKLNLTIIVP